MYPGYDWAKYEGQPVAGSLRHDEAEVIASRILNVCKEQGRIVPVLRHAVDAPADPLHAVQRGNDFGYIDDLVHEGFLTQVIRGGEEYLIPTEKLLQNQRVPHA